MIDRKESHKNYMKKYRQTEKGREYQKNYDKKYREEHKLEAKKYHKKYMKKYQQTAKYKDYHKKYQKDYSQTERGKFVHSQKNAMHRNLGFVLITDDIPDEPYDFHHINHNLVAPLPSDLHVLSEKYNLTTHRFYCYQIIKQLYKNN